MQRGNTVLVHFTCKFEDGTIFESTVGKEPLRFTLGHKQVFSGLDEAVVGMRLGESKTVFFRSAEAFGSYRKELVNVISLNQFPKDIQIDLGKYYRFKMENGNILEGIVTKITDSNFILDANHPLANKDLIFDIKLMEILQPSPPYIISSYPRSGNHWIRYIIEWFSKRPTLGEGDERWRRTVDTPIYEGMAQQEICRVEIQNTNPIAVKRHFIRDNDNRDSGLILIVRDFNECIVKHIKPYVINEINHNVLFENISQYVKLIYDYDNWHADKILLFYEDLIENCEPEINRLLMFCNIFNDYEFRQFINHINKHKERSIKYYETGKGKSETKGIATKYHIHTLSNEKKTLIQNILLRDHKEIFNKYLIRYQQ
ncbi:MAG: FKBP-type peptidyl-prolyl cis-trans isomerase [Thermodesulfovibrionales bacterium]|nr:FKBP-type peptidyl-prolyl cis-trans isomerase [Thermodesulfovibrionales bacterium]